MTVFARPARRVASMLVALAAVGSMVGCSDDSKPGPSAPTVSVGSVRLTATSTNLPVQGGEVDVTATVTSTAGAAMANQQVTFTTTRGTLAPTTPVATDANGLARVKLSTTETATVRATAAGIPSSDLNINVLGPATITTRVEPAEPVSSQPAKITVVAKRGDSDVNGRLTLNFGNGESLDAGMINGTMTVEYTYKTAGGFNLSATVVESDGSTTRETVRVNVRQGSGGGGGRSGADDINPRDIVWLHQDVGSWSITSSITGVSISGSEICVVHTGAGAFPTSRFGDIIVEGNVWVFYQFNGVWYGGTYDWLRPGQVCKAVSGGELGPDQIRISPMDGSWRGPRSGDRVGFMVSARARDNVSAGAERTNIHVTTWP